MGSQEKEITVKWSGKNKVQVAFFFPVSGFGRSVELSYDEAKELISNLSREAEASRYVEDEE